MRTRWGSAVTLVSLLSGAACEAVVLPAPSTNDSTGGASTMGGAPSTGGGPATGGNGACVADLSLPSGAPVTIASDMTQPHSIALVGDHIYVTESGNEFPDGALVRMPKVGGLFERVVTDQASPRAMTSTPNYIYWANYGNGDNGSLNRLSLVDDSVEVLATDLKDPWGIAHYDGSLYATERGSSRVIAVRADLSVDVVSNDIAHPIAVDETGAYLGAIVYEPHETPIRRIGLDGNAADLYDDLFYTRVLLLDGNDLYFGTKDGRIGRGTRGGAPAVTLAEVSDAVNGAVIADCFLYFTLDQGDVGRLPVEGGDVQWLASGQGISLGIAVDDEAIYWVNADGTVRRLDK